MSALCVLLVSAASGQTRKPKKPAKSAIPAAVVTEPAPLPVVEAAGTPHKRNERPAMAVIETVKPSDATSAFAYEFSRPGFNYSRVAIGHDENGKGTISFQKDDSDEVLTDPIQLSAVTLKNLAEAYTALDFINSTEVYQHEKDFSNMGNSVITARKDGRTRTAKYNWTENKHAKFLMDEYRRIGNEYTWKFELMSARANQPLLTPGLMDLVDSYIKRKEISDPPHLLPFLTQLSSDERLPLMARNHAARLAKQIEKSQK